MAAEGTRTGWRGHARRPMVIGTAAVVAVLVIGGATAWAAESSGASGYRTATVGEASIGQQLHVIGTVAPVSDAAAAFQVGGQVTSVPVAVGDQVTAGQTLASLDPTSLTETVSSDQSTVQADEAKLSEDENSQTSTSNDTATTTTTTTPSGDRSNNGGSGAQAVAQVAQDQAALVADQKQASADQQKEAADLTQAKSVCTLPTTPPPTTTQLTSCSNALGLVATDQTKVADDEQSVTGAETTLAQALSAEQSSLSTSSPSSSTGSPSSASSSSPAAAATSTPAASSTGKGGTGGTGASGRNGAGSAASDSAQQIASDQGAIDSAQADLIEAQQALGAATLASPISGTIASVGLAVGDTVSAHSSTSDIVITGTHSFEVTGTLTSAQVGSVTVGDTAAVAVDGTSGTFTGTVSQVGPVQSTSTGYSYPVVVVLPSSATGLFTGSTAAMAIATSHVADVLAVPTSAITTQGTRTFVIELSKGAPIRKVVKVGMVGPIYTQILSGVPRRATVVLADLAQPVPASSSTSTGGFGGFGGSGGFPGGGVVRFSGPGGGKFQISSAGG